MTYCTTYIQYNILCDWCTTDTYIYTFLSFKAINIHLNAMFCAINLTFVWFQWKISLVLLCDIQFC